MSDVRFETERLKSELNSSDFRRLVLDSSVYPLYKLQTECLKSELFGTRTIFKSAEIRTFGFQMFTVHTVTVRKPDVRISAFLNVVQL